MNKASIKRSLYLIRRVYFLQELVELGEVLPISCTGPCNLADFLSKLGFSNAYFVVWKKAIYDPYSP